MAFEEYDLGDYGKVRATRHCNVGHRHDWITEQPATGHLITRNQKGIFLIAVRCTVRDYVTSHSPSSFQAEIALHCPQGIKTPPI